MRRARLVLSLLLLAAAATRAAAQGATTVILVRHAEKVDTNPLDRDAPLSPAGRRRARDLAAALQGRRVDAILVTQFKRTRETARPLAARRGITPRETHLGRDSDSAAAEVVSLIRARHRGQTVVVVGHSATIPRIIALIGGPTLRPLCENAHRHLYTLVVPRAGPVRFTHTHFGAPIPPATWSASTATARRAPPRAPDRAPIDGCIRQADQSESLTEATEDTEELHRFLRVPRDPCESHSVRRRMNAQWFEERGSESQPGRGGPPRLCVSA